MKILVNFRATALGFVLLGLAVMFAAPVYAQGNVDGYIRGQVRYGTDPVVGAEVSAINLDTGRVTTTVSGASGGYRIPKLATGNYNLSISAQGYQTAVQAVTVSIGQGSVVNQSLEAGNVDEIIVTADAVAPIDVSRSETTTVITAMDMERLPIPRDVTAVALLAPGAIIGDTAFGVAKTSAHYSTNYGFASFGGASVGENAYYINGMNVTNFRNGLGGSTVPFEFYDQFQIKTGGFGAEFGRSTGGVMNAVTRRGTNEWKFKVGYNYSPESLRSHAPNVADPTTPGEYDSVFLFDEENRTEAFVTVGGPVIQDKLFVYGIYSLRDIEEDNYTGGGRLLKDIDDDPFWGAKVDWNITDNHSLEFTGFSDKKTQVRTTYVWDEATNVVGANQGNTVIDRGGENYIVKYTGNLTERFTMSLLAGQSEYALTSQAPTDTTCPLAYDSRGGGLNQIGCWVNSQPATAYDEREVFRADFEWAIGDKHLLRFGMDSEQNFSFEQVEYSAGEYFRYFDSVPGDTLSNGGIVPAGVTETTRYRIYNNGGAFDTNADAFYIEDEWLVTDNLTLRLGVRNERFDNRNAEGATFIKINDQYAPRIGLAWDMKGDGSSKFFANYGRYHLPIASNTNIRLSGSENFTEAWYELNAPIQADGSTTLGPAIGPTNVYGDGTVPDVRTTIDLGIDPMYQDEFIIGYEAELWDGYTGGISYTYRTLGEGIEDLTIDEAAGLPGEFHYILANPGSDVHTFYDVDGDGNLDELNFTADELGFPEADRTYHAVTMFLEKSYSDRLYLKGMYTWSQSYGNYEGMVRSDNGQDDAGLTTLYDFAGLLDGAYGNLPNDRRHQLKLWGTWGFADNFQASGSFSFISGRPKNAFGLHPTDPYSVLYGAESFFNQGVIVPRASLGTTDDIMNVNLGLKYVADFDNSSLTLRLDVFNVFDFDDVTEIDEVADEESGAASATFHLPTRFQRPRSVRLGVFYDFGI